MAKAGAIELIVASHAVDRYIERVEAVDPAEARRRLSSRFIQIAARFGAREVNLPTGHHAVIQNMTVVTVRPFHRWKRRRPKQIEGAEV